ncbi:hypothetical protein PAAG_11077 [Paracoccidioides lutzii Pb01]|uniref:Uncharacterized protein n=1 Tax=Paracoccidioides lutzii (strain ATCC MYA-826 / Pb01) TaxID=502779 RepID=A0A0A2V2X7_PARBA|nr:hypothetical protein PAAG_11077 [Paracoccidioides lutzii Pb01]KGQ02126.1 hypothetical protein PAAG_11077 [Paracoccidioides lutzii Pb01]
MAYFSLGRNTGYSRLKSAPILGLTPKIPNVDIVLASHANGALGNSHPPT